MQESLSQIEAVLNAESKRRTEANQITQEHITHYLQELENTLTNRVQDNFKILESRIQTANKKLTKVEQQIEQRDKEITAFITKSKEDVQSDLTDSALLLKNVKGSYKVTHDQLEKKENELVNQI